MSNGNTEIERLVGALRRLWHDQAKRPQSGGLQLAWPDWGRAWIVSWANELDRDMRVIAADLDDARAAPTLDDALVPTENALWRLAAAREKLHGIIALTFGVPSLTVKKPCKTVPGFRVDDKATRARLKGLTQREAAQVLAADATLKSCLLLRHQLSHSLAPIVNAPSMTWFEVGNVRAALSVRLSGWVEALDVDVKEAVLGFIDERFRAVPAVGEEREANAPMRRSIDVAGRLHGVEHLQPAGKEVWRSALDPSDEAFLSAFRSLECLRRLYGPDCSPEDIADAWQAMEGDLKADREPYELLREAAKAVRHGDRPVTRAYDHPVNKARDRRPELLAYAADVVKRALGKKLRVADLR